MVTKTNKTTAVYRDFNLKFLSHPITGDLVCLTDERDVIQSLKNLIFTTAGEFLWEPNIGGGVAGMLFELNLPLLKMQMYDKITQTITRFEPRVEISSLSIDDIAGGNGISITLVFYMLNNSTPATLVIPLKRTR